MQKKALNGHNNLIQGYLISQVFNLQESSKVIPEQELFQYSLSHRNYTTLIQLYLLTVTVLFYTNHILYT